MITGIIAVVIGIAAVVAAMNGEWGSVAVGAVIVILVLALGSESRESDRAYNNFVDYWANGRTPASRGSSRMGLPKEPEYDRYSKPAGMRCPVCHGKVGLAAYVLVRGEKRNQYMCMKCGRTFYAPLEDEPEQQE